MAENNVEKKTQELVGKIITDLGYELYDIEYLKEGKEYHLCIYIDRPEGISIEDCEKVNNVIDPLLDEADFINCVAFGKTAEIISQYVFKGTMIGITGSIRNNNYKKKDGTMAYTTNVIVENITFCDSKKNINNDNKFNLNDLGFVEDGENPFA